MQSRLVAENFFDGHVLHGPTALCFSDDGVVQSIELTSDSPDVYLVSPGLIDVQMNGFDTVDVATATSEDLERLDSLLMEIIFLHLRLINLMSIQYAASSL